MGPKKDTAKNKQVVEVAVAQIAETESIKEPSETSLEENYDDENHEPVIQIQETQEKATDDEDDEYEYEDEEPEGEVKSKEKKEPEKVVEETPKPEEKPKGKGKGGKPEVELSSLDKWIITYSDKVMQQTPEEIEEEKQFKKLLKGASKPEKQKMLEQRGAELRVKQKAAYEQWKLDEIERVERERIAFEKREIREQLEMMTRLGQIHDSIGRFQQIYQSDWNYHKKTLLENEWQLFVECCKLPYPLVCQELNAYLHRWKEEIPNTKLPKTLVRVEEALHLIDNIEDLLNKPLDANESQKREWPTIHVDLMETLQTEIDYAGYFILRQIHMNMVTENARSAIFHAACPWFSLNLWTKLKVPIPMWDPMQLLPPATVVVFEPVHTTITFPEKVNTTCLAVRVLYLNYDHLTRYNPDYFDPPCPDEFNISLAEYCACEWIKKQRIKFARRPRPPPEYDEKGKLIPVPPDPYYEDDHPIWQDRIIYDRSIAPVPSEIIETQESEICSQVSERLRRHVMKYTINLRKYNIVGPIICFDYYYQPPQPKRMMMDAIITSLQIPKKIVNVPYFKPMPDEEHITEKAIKVYEENMKNFEVSQSWSSRLLIDESDILIKSFGSTKSKDMKQVSDILQTLSQAALSRQKSKLLVEKSQEQIRDDTRQEYLDQLIHITIPVPTTVAWFEPPVICYWRKGKKIWMTKHIHDFSIHPSGQSISFRSSLFAPFGFAISKHLNVPFHDWKIQPSPRSKDIIITIVTKFMELDINIQENGKVGLTRVRNVARTIFAGTYNVFMKIDKFVTKLRSHGVDIFPAFDAFCYMDNTCEKHWVIERHLYSSMAAVISAYKFKPSVWNFEAGKRSIMFRTKESTANKWLTGYTTQLRTAFVESSETGTEFNSEPCKGIKFSADFYQLSKNTCSVLAKKKLAEINDVQCQAVYELLTRLRLFSFTYKLPVIPSETDVTHPENN